MSVTRILMTSAVVALLFALDARGEVYRVGQGQQYAQVSNVADKLQPGDVVEITGDTQKAFQLTRSGAFDRPIVIRGITRVENGRIIRPRIVLKDSGITCAGDWNVLEGFDISGGATQGAIGGAVTQTAANSTLRNCRIHHNGQGLSVNAAAPGNTVVEFCEFDSNGTAQPQGRYQNGSGIYAWSWTPGAALTIRHCYFHDELNGYMVRSRSPRNVIEYNWFEGSFHSMLKIINEAGDAYNAASVNPRPMHSDIVGNVFNTGWSPGPRFDILQLGAEGPESAGTEGDFNIAHNLFVITSKTCSAIRINGNVDHVKAFSNEFIEMGVAGALVYDRGPTWDTPETLAFVKRRDSPDPIVEGFNNWVSKYAAGIPDVFKGTLRGINPKLADPLNGDYRPRKDSPLAGAGLWPLPSGRIIALFPEYEPQRGIPTDLKARPRRKATPPSIGPFEVMK